MAKAMPNDHNFADSASCCKENAYNVADVSGDRVNWTNGNEHATPIIIAESNKYIDWILCIIVVSFEQMYTFYKEKREFSIEIVKKQHNHKRKKFTFEQWIYSNLNYMKKVSIIFAIVAAIAAFVSSCKTVDPCPAYPGESSVEQIDSRI